MFRLGLVDRADGTAWLLVMVSLTKRRRRYDAANHTPKGGWMGQPVPAQPEQGADGPLGDEVAQFEWPDAPTLVETLGLSRVNAHLKRVVEHAAHGRPITRMEAGVSADGELALLARGADEEGAELLHVPSFPATMDVLAAVATDMAEVISGFRQRRADGHLLRGESAVLAVGGDRAEFVQWMTDHVVGRDVSFSCVGYYLDHDPWVQAGMCLVVNFEGVRLTGYLPFPFAVEAFVRSGEAIAHLARCEWERWAYADYAMEDELETCLEGDADEEGPPTLAVYPARQATPAPEGMARTASLGNPPAVNAGHLHTQYMSPAESPGWLANHPHALACAVAAALLLYAPAEHPYGYYQLLRVVVFMAALGLAYIVFNWRGTPSATRADHDIVTAVAVVAAVLFNPIVPVTLERSLWAGIDVGAGFFFLLAMVAVERPTTQAT